MNKQSSIILNAGLLHAKNVVAAAEKADNELTDALLILIGMCLSVLDKDRITFTEKELVFMDANASSMNEDKIVDIRYNNEDALVASVVGNDDTEIEIVDLPTSTRIDLVKAITAKLTARL